MRSNKLVLVLGLLLQGFSLVAKADPLDDKLLKNYLSMAQDLASDSFQNLNAQAKELVETINAQKEKKGADLYKKIASSAQIISAAKNIDEARNEFQNLSEGMKGWFEKEKPAAVDVMFCPMKKAHWLQKVGEATQNPYFGKSMLSCGYSVTKKLK